MRKTLIAIATVALAGTLGACSTETSQPEPTVTETVTVTADPVVESDAYGEPVYDEPGNPVDIAKQITGCRVDPAASLGEYDVDGNRYVSCNFYNNGGGLGTEATVTTYPYDIDAEFLGSVPDDSTAFIYGDRFLVRIDGANAYDKAVHVKTIAEQVGGTVQ